MKQTRRQFLSLLAAASGSAVSRAQAREPIPPFLVGVWASADAVLRGPYLFEGQAVYLGADGVGALLGGPPPIGVKILATFDTVSNTIDFDMYEGSRRGPHGQIRYDPASESLYSDDGKTRLTRRFTEFSEDMRKALGITS